MNKFPCDGCWLMAVARARSNDGRVDLWYAAYHREAHGLYGLREVTRSAA